VVCNCEKTPFDDESFTFVMMNGGVISYTPNPGNLLKETNRILKSGGILWFDFLNSLGWAIETTEPELKAKLALEDDRLIKIPDWDYPARLMSMNRIESMLKDNGFRIQSKYGLILLSNSLPLNDRYSTKFDRSLVEKYKNIELILSRKPECVGSSWSCAVCAIKE
jgi:ubiquinone/menaquinone biosynthesis C-methylase UbiE